MKDWLSLQKEFLKGNLAIAHAGTVLTKILQYDLPVVKKEIKTLERAITDALVKHEGLCKQERSAEAAFLKECGEETKGSSDTESLIKQNTLAQTGKLVELYTNVEGLLQSKEMRECLEYREQFLMFFKMAELETQKPTLLRYLSGHGNTTFAYQRELNEKKLGDAVSERVSKLEKDK